jgi:hypothetical protein
MLKGDQTLCDCGHYATCDGLGTGYETNAAGVKTCYTCIGDADRKALIETGKQIGCLVSRPYSSDGKAVQWFYTNWLGSFEVKVGGAVHHSRNNFGAARIDFWFTFEGAKYWGVNIGDNQIARVRRIK